MLLIPPSDSNDPIRIFHPSFPDFLLDSERIARCIFPELLYSCKFWKAHLDLMINECPILAETIRSFVLAKLLPWIECLSILSSISVALPALRVAQLWCKVSTIFAPRVHMFTPFSAPKYGRRD
jgi:hypothetical protein